MPASGPKMKKKITKKRPMVEPNRWALCFQYTLQFSEMMLRCLFCFKKMTMGIVRLSYLYCNDMKTTTEMSKIIYDNISKLWRTLLAFCRLCKDTSSHEGTLHPYGPHKPVCCPITCSDGQHTYPNDRSCFRIWCFKGNVSMKFFGSWKSPSFFINISTFRLRHWIIMKAITWRQFSNV